MAFGLLRIIDRILCTTVEGIEDSLTASTGDLPLQQQRVAISLTTHICRLRVDEKRFVYLQIQHIGQVAVETPCRDRIYGRSIVLMACYHIRQILREYHRIDKQTGRLIQLQIDDTVARGCGVQEYHRIHESVGVIRGIVALLPFESFAFAVVIAERISLRLSGRSQRLQMQVIVQHIFADTACGTQRDMVVTAFEREVKCRRHLVGPSVWQSFDVPLVVLYMVCLADQGITLDVVNLLYPGGRSVELNLIDTVAAATDDVRFLHFRDRVGSQRRGIEREETGTVLHEHTIDYVQAIIHHTGLIRLTTA